MAKISIDELMALMAKPGVEEAELAPYFVFDEDASAPFAPKFRLNPDKVAIPPGPTGEERSALAMNTANWFARMHRKSVFYQRLSKGYNGPILVSEGDSWFQYPMLLKDTIDHISTKYAVYSLDAAGDLLERMAAQQEYLKALEETGASIMLFSGGGNDLLANGALASHLEEYHPDLNAGDYLKPSFSTLLNSAFAHYERILRQVHGSFPHVQVLCHGYDYPVPNNGQWLGKPMQSRKIRDRALQKAIAAEMMDQFNRGLRRLCQSMPHVTYIDCRGVVRDDRWYDELHPIDTGYGDVAVKFIKEIKRLSNTRSGPQVVFDGPFGTRERLSRAMAAPAVAPAATGRGMSLHIGLNEVDPNHYAGWNGALLACENDAHAMAALAERQGFVPELILTRNATREAVVSAIERVAAELGEGDMFFLTVSGHGGRIPDFNQDEEHDGDQKMDETLCLFDFQLADDELYMLWSKFKPGVRVLMMPDTCHSGSMVRFNPTDPFADNQADALVVDPRIRAMPRHVETKVWRNNLDAYREHARSYESIRESVVLSPLTTPVQASVLNLGACQDHQQAMDGDNYGAFTGAVLKVWNNGRYSGDYASFRDEVDAAIGSASQTPSLFTKLVKDEAFVRQVPFTLWPGRRTTVLGSRPGPAPTGSGAPVAAAAVTEPSPAEGLMATEGDERDELSQDQIDAIAAAKESGTGFRDANAALTWPDYSDFRAFIDGLGLQHFAADEFLVLGGGHNSPGSACAGKNGYPPRNLWPNIANTAKALDRFRGQIRKPIVITNAYRAPAYNACIGGASASQHKRFCAIDFAVKGMSAAEAAMALRWMRDREGAFSGGIGRYNSFVHVDTRGANATWPDAFKNQALPEVGPEALSPDERVARLSEIKLAPRARGGPTGASAFAKAVPRSGEDFDPMDEAAAHQQELKAAVNASSVVSFVENLTPGQKEDVLLSTLFAQRAADARFDPIKNRDDWFNVYMDTLGVMGWSRESAPFQANKKMTGNGRFDQVILTTLASIATGNQFKIIESAMDALRGLADDDGKIQLFDFETSKTEGGNFQIGAAEAAGEVVSMALGAFNFVHRDKKRNVLFVSWGQNELTFWLSAQKINLSPDIYTDVREIVRDRLKTTRKTLIADIPI